MTLYDGNLKIEYKIEKIDLDIQMTQRLQALGFNPGTKISIVNRVKNGAMIVRIRGSRLALGKHITKNIHIFVPSMIEIT